MKTDVMNGMGMSKNATFVDSNAMKVRKAIQGSECTIGEIAQMTGLEISQVRSSISNDLSNDIVLGAGFAGKHKLYTFNPNAIVNWTAVAQVKKAHRAYVLHVGSKVYDALYTQGPMSVKSIAAHLGCDGSIVRKHIETMMEEGKVKAVGKQTGFRHKFPIIYAISNGNGGISLKTESVINMLGLKALA